MKSAPTILLLWLSTLSGVLGSEHLVIISPHWEGLRFETARGFSDWHQQRFGSAVEVAGKRQGVVNDKGSGLFIMQMA